MVPVEDMVTAQTRASTLIKAISTAAMAAVVIISFAVYHASMPKLAVFVLFVLLYVQIPGLLVIRTLNIRTIHISVDLLLSFFTGWAMVIAEYFLCDLLNNDLILYLVGPIYSGLYIYFLITKRFAPAVIGRLSLLRIPAGMYAATAILMVYVFLHTQFMYLSPELCSDVYASIDKVYQMGLSMSLSRDYPLACPWVDGVIEYYHLYTQILFSVPLTLFGLSPDFITMSCAPYLTTYTIALGFYALFRHFCARKDRAGLYTLSVLLSHMFIARTATASYMFRILLVNDNHGGFAIACLMACAIMMDICLKKRAEEPRSGYKEIVLLTALAMLLTGIKAPVGLVLAGGVIGTFLLGLILKTPVLRIAALPTATISAGFIATYMFLLGSDPTSGATNETLINFGRMTGICFWKYPLIESLQKIGIPGPVRLLCILAVFACFFFTIYTIAFAAGYIREFVLIVTKKKDYDFARVCVYATALVGFVLMMFLSYEGHSQVYFGTATTAFAPLIAFWFIEDRPSFKSKPVIFLYKASLVWFFSVIILTSISLFAGMYIVAPSAAYHAQPEATYNPYQSLSSDEYDAVMWLKDNTPEDSLIASQMYASVSPEDFDYHDRWSCCHFLYAAYSCRMFYLEGSGFSLETYEAPLRLKMIRNTDKLYDPKNSGRGDLARSLGVDYVMVTKKTHPATPDLSSDDYKPVFSNDDVDIYEVRDAS